MIDELLVQRLLAEYCQLCDDGDLEGLIARFTPDATFQFGRWTVEGHAGLRRWFERNQSPALRGKRLGGDLLIDFDGDRAVVRSDFVFLAIVDGVLSPLIAGRYRDELRRVDGDWLIHRRAATTLGSSPTG